MPSAHRVALKKLLDAVKQQIAKDEAKLLRVASDDERTKLVDEIADLHIRRDELWESLNGAVE
jgi:predicted  nucleic acid-binding Zn-ribbon protein